MGTIVGAAIVAHHPGLFRPEADRLALNQGQDSDLVAGFDRVRAKMDEVQADTLVIFDTHWFTTMRHLIAGAAHYAGRYTSPELPWILDDVPYDYPGAPELAAKIDEVAQERNLPVYNACEPKLAPDYPTVNLLDKLWRREKILRVGVCQNALGHHFLQMGEAIGEAIRRMDGRFMLIGSGALSHRMINLDFQPKHPAIWHADNISDPKLTEVDERILAMWAKGDHASAIDAYPEMRAAAYEGLGGHYMQMVAALGGRECHAKGEPLSAYEVAVGTANMHVWFDVLGAQQGAQA